MTTGQPMPAEDVLLNVSGLSVSFGSDPARRLDVLSDVNFSVRSGEIVGVVGESGSGKSVTALAIMRLLGPHGQIGQGRIELEGQDLASLPEGDMRRLRGRRLSMVFQEPMTSLNPLLKIGFQVSEVLREHFGLSAQVARERAIKLLGEVGIANPAERFNEYPHSLSGGMRQRVLIAMAIACEPRLLIADEPTTALDVTIQAQILELLSALRTRLGSAILLITHDMGVIARMADRVIVMYAGEIAEVAPLRSLFQQPLHPYTRLLLAAMPTVLRKVATLPVIPGAMPSPAAFPGGCRFHPRCAYAVDRCIQSKPELRPFGPDRQVRCWRVEEIAEGKLA